MTIPLRSIRSTWLIGLLALSEAYVLTRITAPHRPGFGISTRSYPAVHRGLHMATPTKDDKVLAANEKNETQSEDLVDVDEKPGEAYPEMKLEMTPAMQEKKESRAPKDITPDPSFLDGEAKVEERGDREKIMNSIRAYQYEVWKNEPKIPFELIVQRLLDTGEDAMLHLRRVPYDLGWVPEEEKEDRPTIVVLGSGWAAHALLKVADTYKLRIIVVSPSNHFVFTPMLASASVGTVEYRSMTEAVRAANPMIHNYLEGQATDVDIEKQTIKVKLNSLLKGVREGEPPEIEVSYDKLVVAVGCKVADTTVPGAFEHSLRLKTCDDARRLRTAVGEALEFASRPAVRDEKNLAESERILRREERRRRLTFAIVGGGPTGVELAGELSDFFEDITKPRVGAYPGLRDDIRIVLIQGASELVPQFDEDLRAHALKSLKKRGVEVRLRTRVNEVGDGFLKIVPKGGGQEEETLLTGIIVWAAGTEAVPFVGTLLKKLPQEAQGPQGKVNIDPWLRCAVPDGVTFGSILVMGDAAAFADGDNSFLPQTAQVAGQQGAYIARLLDRDYDLSVTPPKLTSAAGGEMMDMWLKLRGLERAEGFDFLNLGLLAYVGGGEALTQVELGDVPIFSYAGSISFILWRSVYLVKQVATRNRVLVTFDWIKSYLFGRDITRL